MQNSSAKVASSPAFVVWLLAVSGVPMTEPEWLGTADLYAMVDSVYDNITARQTRLFACACCRRVWNFLNEDWMRDAVTTMERFADGAVSQDVFETTAGMVWMKACERREWVCPSSDDPVAYKAFRDRVNAYTAVMLTTRLDPCAVRTTYGPIEGFWDNRSEVDLEHRAQRDILRDIVGNPFRPVVRDQTLLRCQQNVEIRDQARRMYDANRYELKPFGRLLEAAGCTNEQVLEHCLGDSSHVRGCFAVDLFLDIPGAEGGPLLTMGCS